MGIRPTSRSSAAILERRRRGQTADSLRVRLLRLPIILRAVVAAAVSIPVAVAADILRAAAVTAGTGDAIAERVADPFAIAFPPGLSRLRLLISPPQSLVAEPDRRKAAPPGLPAGSVEPKPAIESRRNPAL